MILGAMQDWPLLVGTIMDHAERFHGDAEVVSRLVEGPIHRSNYREIAVRSRKFAAALVRLGIVAGDRVATLAWNTHRHMESWYGITHIGAVYHTVNPRLFDAQLEFIITDADDRILLADLTFLPILERLADGCLKNRRIIMLTDRAHMPESTLDLLCYEDLLAAEDDGLPRVMVPENAPCGLCYTSGTTGNPKGVLYSHRSNVLQSLMAHGPDVLALSATTTVMPIVPMFHANAWSLVFSAPMTGAKLVMPGPNMDAPSVCRLIVDEGVDFACAVPSVWIDAIPYMKAHGKGKLNRTLIGGSAVPRWMVKDFAELEIEVRHGWGMTELSPVGALTSPKPGILALSAEAQLDQNLKQGVPMYGVDVRILGADGAELPHDDTMSGQLQARGPCVVGEYFKSAGGNALTSDGWFDTGDIAAIDHFGYIRITDRTKDVIKSGGEWISSIELEGEAAGCPGVKEAAAIGIAHPRWVERPVLVVVREAGSDVAAEDIMLWLSSRVAKWWLPDRVEFVDELPHTATGKLDKKCLRLQFADLVLE